MSRTSTASDSLPDDDALDAFSNVLPPPKKRPDKPAPPPATTPADEPAEDAVAADPAPVDLPVQADPPEVRQAEPEPAPAAVETPTEQPAQAAAEVAVRPAAPPVQPRPIADLGIQRQDGPQRSTQCTVNVSLGVRARFAAYQLAKKLERGSEPTNAVVVRRAVLHARKNDLFGRMLEAIRHRQTPLEDEDDDPEGLFGDVVGRRAERGRVREVAQLPFRPSYAELDVIDALARGYGFANRSVFLDAALDEFLPPLEKRRRS